MPIVRHPDLEALLRGGYADRLHERDLRMADIPAGARLEYGPAGPRSDARAPWPVVVVRNVWVLPGVPSIFRRKFEAVRDLFRAGPIHGRALFSRAGEGRSPARMDEAVIAFPDVEIGSYPHPEARGLPREDHHRRPRRAPASTARWRGWPSGWATPWSVPNSRDRRAIAAPVVNPPEARAWK